MSHIGILLYSADYVPMTENMKRAICVGAAIVILSWQASAADWTKLRRVAQVGACLASGMDAVSTWQAGQRGAVELNGLLGRGRPQMGRVISLKAGLCAGGIAWAEWQHHRNEGTVADFRNERTSAYVGLGMAGLFSGLAVHNAGVLAGGR